MYYIEFFTSKLSFEIVYNTYICRNKYIIIHHNINHNVYS